MRYWTNEHGNDGLRRKFDVYKPRTDVAPPGTGYSMYPQNERLGADGEFVFVLRPEVDREAWYALHQYAHFVAERAPQLAADIREQLHRILVAQDHGD